MELHAVTAVTVYIIIIAIMHVGLACDHISCEYTKVDAKIQCIGILLQCVQTGYINC